MCVRTCTRACACAHTHKTRVCTHTHTHTASFSTWKLNFWERWWFIWEHSGKLQPVGLDSDLVPILSPDAPLQHICLWVIARFPIHSLLTYSVSKSLWFPCCISFSDKLLHILTLLYPQAFVFIILKLDYGARRHSLKYAARTCSLFPNSSSNDIGNIFLTNNQKNRL